MSTIVSPRDPHSDTDTADGPPEPQVTLGVVMLATAVVPAIAIQYFGPEVGGKLLAAMIPLLLVAVLRTSITPYTVFESFGPRRQR